MGIDRGIYELEGKGWVANSRVTAQAKSLPKGQHIERVMLEFEVVISNTSGGTITPNYTQLLQFLQNIDHVSEGAYVRATGRSLTQLGRLMTGKRVSDVTETVSIANAASGTLRAMVLSLIHI